MSTNLCDLQYALCVAVGSSLERTFRFKDSDGELIDLTDYHAEIDIREKLGDREPMFTLDSDAPSAAGSTLTIDGPAGEVTMYVAPDETLAWLEIAKDKKVYWDLRLTDTDGKTRIYFRASDFTMKPVATRIEPED